MPLHRCCSFSKRPSHDRCLRLQSRMEVRSRERGVSRLSRPFIGTCQNKAISSKHNLTVRSAIGGGSRDGRRRRRRTREREILGGKKSVSNSTGHLPLGGDTSFPLDKTKHHRSTTAHCTNACSSIAPIARSISSRWRNVFPAISHYDRCGF